MRIKIKILRYNPEVDTKPHYENYVVEQEPTDKVLDALNTIKWYQDGTLSYRRSSRTASADLTRCGLTDVTPSPANS
ncbi:MAG: 2Fe-2S iron-sulfur cluster-binding protein [Thermomicrobiales bacterium]